MSLLAPRTHDEEGDPAGGGGEGVVVRRGHDSKGIILSGSHTSSPFPPLPFVFPVVASKSHLSRVPSRKKKNGRGHVIKVTEMSEKFFLQESEASE